MVGHLVYSCGDSARRSDRTRPFGSVAEATGQIVCGRATSQGGSQPQAVGSCLYCFVHRETASTTGHGCGSARGVGLAWHHPFVRRFVVLLAVIPVIYFGGRMLFATNDAQPTFSQIEAAGQDAFDDEMCHVTTVKEIHWPCVRVTGVQFLEADSNLETPVRKDPDEYRACFNLTIEVETTRWDADQEVPMEPRTFAELPDPKRVCYLVGHGGHTGWSLFSPGTQEWWQPLTREAWKAQCQLGPCDD